LRRVLREAYCVKTQHKYSVLSFCQKRDYFPSIRGIGGRMSS